MLLSGLAGCVSSPSQNAVDRPVSQQEALSDERVRAKAHTELGAAYLQEERFAIALEEGRVAISADSGYAPAYNLLGLVHMYLHENAAAEDNFRRALSLAPNDPEINNNYGIFLCRSGHERQAMAYFMAAVKNPLYTTPTRSYTSAGLCSSQIRDDKAAEDYLLRAVRADANNVQAIYGLADLLHRLGRDYEARARLTELHRLTEPNAQSAWLALRVERKLGDREGETRYNLMLRRKFQGTSEYQKLMQGQYE
jgi:type IV pilus assembly protein PilF